MQIKEAPRHWSLCGEFTGDRGNPRTNGQLRGKCFHLMTSSWKRSLLPCNQGVGGSYESSNNYPDSVVAHYSIHERFSNDTTQLREAISPLAGRLSHRLCIGGLAYLNRFTSGVCWDHGTVQLAGARPSEPVETFAQPPSQYQGYSRARSKPYILLKMLLLYCVICNISPNQSLCSYPHAGNRNPTYCLPFPIFQLYTIYLNITRAYFYQKIVK